MPDIYFPTRLFGFTEKEVDIERQTLVGGTSLSGETDRISTDGGGRVFAEFSGGSLLDRNAVLAWRALATQMEEGVATAIVPFCDRRHTPYRAVTDSVPHSDGTPHSDESLYAIGSDETSAIIASPGALRATTLEFTFGLEQPLMGGEWFSFEHATKGWRAYRVATVVGGVVTFRPPLREAVAVNEVADFLNPRCKMTVDGRISTRTTNNRTGAAAVRFVEAR